MIERVSKGGVELEDESLGYLMIFKMCIYRGDVGWQSGK